MTGLFIQAFIYLIAAVIAVPIAKRLGLGSVLGYLIAGIIIGPVLGLVGQETTTIQHFAEFGVVMMLFLVGLELDPKMLWAMRNKLLGLGGLQVGLTTAAIMGIFIALGTEWPVALTVGMIFSLSSTAIVLQTFQEKGLSKTDGGRNAFSVLLFQDIAFIPMIAIIPFLALPELIEAAQNAATAAADHHEDLNIVAHLPSWAYGLVIIAAMGFVVVGGHFLSRPLFRFVANSGLREVFTATALMLVIGIAALMSLVGLSPALGTFLAGVVLANSEFRHELESNIEPFKGLLLGLFFITVGAGVNFALLASEPVFIIGMALLVMAVKASLLFILALIFKMKGTDKWLFALSLAQAGEFGFVLLAFSAQNHALPLELNAQLSLVVALSMCLTPGLFILFDKVIVPRFAKDAEEREADDIDETGCVIIAGTGRFGQIINRLLVANGIPTVGLDQSTSQIENLRAIKIKSYYGDATRAELLHTAGIEQAKMLVVAIDDRIRATELVHHVRHAHPNIKILARAFDRGHSYELRQAGADYIVAETYYSALEMGGEALKHLGFHAFRAEQLKANFLETEEKHRDTLYETWKESGHEGSYTKSFQELFMQLEEAIGDAMRGDRSDKHDATERGWTPPPKGYTDKIKGD